MDGLRGFVSSSQEGGYMGKRVTWDMWVTWDTGTPSVHLVNLVGFTCFWWSRVSWILGSVINLPFICPIFKNKSVELQDRTCLLVSFRTKQSFTSVYGPFPDQKGTDGSWDCEHRERTYTTKCVRKRFVSPDHNAIRFFLRRILRVWLERRDLSRRDIVLDTDTVENETPSKHSRRRNKDLVWRYFSGL